MRFYNIEIYQPGSTKIFRQYTSFPGGQNDPGALNVVIDTYESTYATPAGLTALQIWGVPIADISQANNFTDCTIKVYGGFQKGLPLNNPAQAGLLYQGTIYQSFGNWLSTDMTLDFVIYGSGQIAAAPANISFSWPAGTTLASALATTLTNAFPGVKQLINISSKLVLGHDEWGIYSSMVQFAQMLKPIAAEILGGTYQGVEIAVSKGTLIAFDGSTQTAPVTIAFQDLIGQPTWIQSSVIQFMCPMRADISVGQYVAMPKGLLGSSSNAFGAPGAVTTTAASQPQARQQSVFSGVFMVTMLHHMGQFRAADGTAWVTVFEAALVPKQP